MMDRMNRTSRTTSESMSRAQSATNRLGGAVSSTSNRMNGFSASISRLHVGSNGLSASFGGLQSTLVGLASAYIGANGAAKLLNATIGEAAKFEQSKAIIQAAFQDDNATNQYMKMVDKMAIDSPLLNSGDMFAGSKGLLTLTKDMKQLGTAWKLVERLVASDPTKSIDDAVRGMRELASGDTISLRDVFNLDKNILNDVKGGSFEEQLRGIDKALNKMNITQDTVEAMGSTTLGRWNSLKERVGTFFRDMGGESNSKLGTFLQRINDAIDTKIDVKSLSDKLGGMLGKVTDKAIALYDLFVKFRKPISYAAGAVATFVGALAGVGIIAALANPVSLIAAGIAAAAVGLKALYDNSKAVRGVINGISSAFKSVSEIFKNGLKGYGTARNLLEDAGFSEGQIRAIMTFGYSLKDAFDKVKAVFKSTAKIFGGEHKASLDILKSAGFSDEQTNLIRKFGYSLKSAFDMVKGVFSGIGTLIIGGGTVDLLTALGFSPETATKVDGQISGIISKVSEFITNVKSKFGEVKAYISEKITQLSPTFDRLKEIFSTAWSTIVSIWTNAWSIIEPYLQGFWNMLQILGDIAVTVFNNVIAPAISFLVQLFSTLWSVAKPILELLGIAWEALSTIIKWAWDNVLAPLVDFILTSVKNALDNFSGALSIVQGWFETLSGWISTAKDHVKDFIGFISNVKLPSWISNGISAGVNFVGNLIGAGEGKKGGKKSHYSGLDSVPYDGYSARLHKGERVLTARENKDYSEGNNGGITIAKLADSIVIREEADIDKFAYKLAKLIEKERTQVG
ncbi:phage tail tape measure protein [Lysinibacillus sp. OL1_EC]|nr:phage tail tape measure protein [Lysinibacillus sp. OL1_EC]TBV84799.1 phage tail tape measure protein [Lysinibacillus sp. OL1]